MPLTHNDIEFFDGPVHHYPLPVPNVNDQLPIYAQVGRGIQGNSYKVDVLQDTDNVFKLRGGFVDSVTGVFTEEWISDNISGGKLEYSYNLNPFSEPKTFTITFRLNRPGKREWEWTTPAIPYVWEEGSPDNDYNLLENRPFKSDEVLISRRRERSVNADNNAYWQDMTIEEMQETEKNNESATLLTMIANHDIEFGTEENPVIYEGKAGTKPNAPLAFLTYYIDGYIHEDFQYTMPSYKMACWVQEDQGQSSHRIDVYIPDWGIYDIPDPTRYSPAFSWHHDDDDNLTMGTWRAIALKPTLPSGANRTYIIETIPVIKPDWGTVNTDDKIKLWDNIADKPPVVTVPDYFNEQIYEGYSVGRITLDYENNREVIPYDCWGFFKIANGAYDVNWNDPNEGQQSLSITMYGGPQMGMRFKLLYMTDVTGIHHPLLMVPLLEGSALDLTVTELLEDIDGLITIDLLPFRMN